MPRDITTAMQEGLEARAVRPVLIGRLDILGDPVFAWTGPGLFAPSGTGDSALDGQTFSPSAAFVNISAISEDQSTGGPVTVTATAHKDDEPLLRQVVRDKKTWRGRPAYLWLGLLNADEDTVLANPVRIKTGVMASMVFQRNTDSAVVDVVIDVDLSNAGSASFRLIDHARIHPSDTFSSYIIKLSNQPQGFQSPSIQFNQSPGGANFDPQTVDFFDRP